MRICKIWDAEYPWDVRAEKIASSLTRAGHEVHLIARNRDRRPILEQLPECTVHRLTPLPWVGHRLNAASMFPAFFNPRWLSAITRVARNIAADCILVRDLPLAPSAIWVGRRLGLPVILDMAENYPAMIRSRWENDCHRFADWFVRNPAAVQRVERWCLRRVDHILVVVEESRARLVRQGIPADRISIVSNTPARSRLASAPASATTAADGALDVTYLGILEEPRGIATLMRAAAICRQDNVPVRLSLIGDGRERNRFEALARELRLDGVVRFHGYLPHREALQALEHTHVGAIPHHADESWNTTIPNKLFDYMAAGVPVLASHSPPVARVVEETGCGEVFRSQDPQDAARALARLSDPAHRRRCGEAGRAAVVARYNWDADQSRLLRAISAYDKMTVS